jgi:hypothetical protein
MHSHTSASAFCDTIQASSEQKYFQGDTVWASGIWRPTITRSVNIRRYWAIESTAWSSTSSQRNIYFNSYRY